MLCLDLDLDFFLNDIAYSGGYDCGRLSSKYKPWSISEVRHFLEERCGLSLHAPVQGLTIESHDGVIDFWRALIKSGRLPVPFDVIHVDAHPDLWVGAGLNLKSEFLHVDSELVLAMLNNKQLHPGNYLTFAIAYRWLASLVWVHLRRRLNRQSIWDGDARSGLMQFKQVKDMCSDYDLPVVEKASGIPFKILPWRKFRTVEKFDYIAFTRSPGFTPPESDELIPVVEEYMIKI